MLDSETKRRIDALKDILVGKIPNPQSQVEQITNGLIYKFMDDMDQESIEMGGEGSFFVNDYEKYAWKNLLDPKLSGADRVNLYSEGIERLFYNPTAPLLFRDIFKNAFLPFKDPSTLNMFLKEIDEFFHYSDSEKLGDSFEYLLSFMGSQGDAGQFRTPRHIIDFIVEIINPQKNETILDPACGTAGFLISSYKHILKTNTDKKLGDKLSAEDKKKVGKNVSGYDISPEMVRLSLVNMYLHGFSTPKIDEYDTLSSEDKWNEYFDVILANPPFFSPTGGIQPHKRFGVESKKAEVLFTSYILEHLKPNGRAGIIVPEGIIFQNGKAYKELRKQLMEGGLIGVISLPPGIFNPYSGVKTSIIVIDKQMAKNKEDILFINIENDGYSLSTSRKEIEGSQIQVALDSFNEFIQNKSSLSFGLVVNKSEIEKINFSLDYKKYIHEEIFSEFNIIKLGTVIEESKTRYSGEKENIFSVSNTKGIINPEEIFDNRIASKDIKNYKKITKGFFAYNPSRINVGSIACSEKEDDGFVSPMYVVFQGDNKKILNNYLLQMLKSKKGVKLIEKYSSGSVRRTLKFSDLSDIPLPLPPLNVQQEIVDELEGYQKIIDGCKQVAENYKPTIDIDSSWEMVELGEVCEINPKKSAIKELGDDTLVSFVPMEVIEENNKIFIPREKKKLSDVYKGYTYFKDKDVLIAKVTPCFENGKSAIVNGLENGIGFGSTEFIVLRSSGRVLEDWIYLNIVSDKFKKLGVENFTGTSGLRRVPKDFVQKYRIPLPSLDIQKKIVQKIEEERKVIESNKKLIEIYTQKIKDRINKVWGED